MRRLRHAIDWRWVLLSLPMLILFGLGSLLSAQERPEPGLSVNLGGYNALIRRGVTRTNQPVLQVDALATLPSPGRGALVVGTWVNLEPTAYDDEADLSVLGTDAGAMVTMTYLWAEYQHPVGPVRTSAGVLRKLYPATAGVAAAYNTTEVYLRGAWQTRFSPTVVYYLDVSKVKGGYLAVSARHRQPLTRRLSVQASALAGMNLGQDTRSGETGYFANDGWTHVDLGTAATWDFGSITLTPSLHLIHALDEAVRITGPDEERRRKALIGVALGWSM